MRALILDDSEVMRTILKHALGQSDLELTDVLYASNGVEGLSVIEDSVANNQPIDIILCDLHMPIMDGLQFLLEKQLRNLAQGVPVVMITAESDYPQLLRSMQAGAQSFLIKPFSLEQIQTCVASLLLATTIPS
jgi:two-component system chemotaxis response regulator CheY